MVMTATDLREHADNLRETLRRKIAELWDCHTPDCRTRLLTQTKALASRIAELDQQVIDSERVTEEAV